MIAPLVRAFLRRYAESEGSAVIPFAVGRRWLDLGAGEGYVAAALRAKTGAWLCSVDVGLFGRAAGPYVAYNGANLPFDDESFDTTLILLALHHCAEPERVLKEAARVTRHRLIITESVYRTHFEHACLDLLDGWLNGFRHGGQMNMGLAFRTAEGWLELFEAHGLVVVDVRWLGSRWERIVHHPVLFVLEKSPGA